MRKLICFVAIVATAYLVYWAIANRNISVEASMPPLPEYPQVNTNPPTVAAQADQPLTGEKGQMEDTTVESSLAVTTVITEPPAKYVMAKPSQVQPKFVSEEEVRNMQQAAAKEQINRSTPQPGVQNYRPPQFQSGNQ